MPRRAPRPALALTVVGLTLSTALVACGDGDGGSDSVGTITLKVADWLPEDHLVVREGTQPWMDRVTELTDGKVKFDYYPAEQLGPAADLFKLTLSGVTDIGFVNPAYVPENLSLSSVSGLPGLAATSCQNSVAFQHLIEPGSTVYEHEFEPEGLHPLLVSATAGYEVMTSGTPVTGPDDLEGLTVALSGGAMARMAELLNAAPVSMSAPDRYDAMRKGTIDATILGYATAPTYSLQEVVKYGTVGANLGSSASAYSISTKTWDGLPTDVQDAMTQASDEITLRLCKALDASTEDAEQTMIDAGVEVHELTDDEKESFADAVAPVAEAWIDEDLPADKREFGQDAIDDYVAGAADAPQ